jgi:exosortase
LINRARYVQLLALAAASIAIWWRPLAATVRLAWSSDAHTHILLILPLSMALVYFDSRSTRPAIEWSPSAGGILLALGLIVRFSATWRGWDLPADQRLSLSMLGLVIFWIGSVVVLFGVAAFRAFLYPLCLLFLIIPLPEPELGGVTELLQNQSAVGAGAMFRVAGVPVERDGIMLSIPGLDIEVATECSSIRSSMMLVVTTLVLAHLFLRSWWKKSILILAAIPLSIAKNAFRIFTIAELGTRVDPGFLVGRLHRNGGIVFFALSVAAISVLLWILRRTESATPVRRSATA